MPEVLEQPATTKPSLFQRVSDFSDRRPLVMCALAGLLVILIRLAVLPVLPIPIPGIHDEFSYLLGAETFASGRITNPPHPMWVHFETFHTNFLPTYHSKYPPAQSLIMAFGQVVFGHPWYGVLLSVGLMIAAVCWMLQGWLLRGGVWLGTALAILEWGLPTYWMNSYWGGALPALGGALIIGALPRLAKNVTLRLVAVATLGLMILANARPYEGALLGLSAGVGLVWWRYRDGLSITALLRPAVIATFAAIVIPVFAAMMYYNFRTTGSATTFPYSINQARYSASPHLYVLPDQAIPRYNHEIHRKQWEDFDRGLYIYAREHPFDTMRKVYLVAYTFYFPEALVLAILLAVMLRRGTPTLVLALIVLTGYAGLAIAKSVLAHYYAPVFGAFLVLIMIGIGVCNNLKQRVFGYPLGHLLLIIILGVTTQHAIAQTGAAFRRFYYEQPLSASYTLHVKRLERQGGKHLVIVRYGADHDAHLDWVFNRADIDASSVVWAHDMGWQRNLELLDYYKDRKIWLYEPDNNWQTMLPYPR